MKVIDGGIKRKYYKYGTTLNSAITQVGGTYTNGVFTGASGAHLLLPVLPITTANSWEIQTVYTYNGGGTYPTVIAPSTSGYGIQWIVVNGAYYISLSRNGAESLIVSQTTGISAVAGTPYYFKLGFTGSKYYLSYNTDGSDNYTEAWSYSSTEKVYTEIAHYLMDWGVGTNRWSAGSINMPKTKIYINDNLYLTGTQPEPATESDYDYYEDVEVSEVVEGEQETITTWEDWVSPTLTSATSYGTISGALTYTFFNGSSGAGRTATDGTTYTTYWEFPAPIKLSTVYWFAKANPDRWGTNCQMNFYSVDANNNETSVGSASYSYSGGGSNGSRSLDDTIEVTKLKITTYGNWGGGANGSWYLPISFDGYVKTTKTYTHLYAVRN